MKILYVGDFTYDYYDEEMYNGLRCSLSDDVVLDRFEWGLYFKNYKYENMIQKIYYGIQNRYKFGPTVSSLNNKILALVKENEYESIFNWRGIHIYPSTLRAIKNLGVVIVGYNNDRTYSPHHPWWVFWRLRAGLVNYDMFYVYRDSDLKVLKDKSIASKVLLPSIDQNRIYPLCVHKKYNFIFIGHYENDGRDELICELFKLKCSVGVFGSGWEKSSRFKEIVSVVGDIVPAYDNYNEVLNSSRVAICFLSKLNEDTYTRRTFEIPMARVLLFSEYTIEQSEFLTPDVEAVYFLNKDEFLEKASWLLGNALKVEEISLAGREAVLALGVTTKHRADTIVKDIIKMVRV